MIIKKIRRKRSKAAAGQEFMSFSIQDEILLIKLRTIKPKRNLMLEADTFYTPSPVKENDKPVYPKIGILINHNDGLVVAYEILQDTYYLFRDVCEQLRLPLEMVEHLEFAEQVRVGMFDMKMR